ncbi:restriction endonuclease subunit S [Staphylococcus gallinarum]|uniref:restriction endonuclease subunit S n=1 Tax=Staphylococcus gallinarum TaxID=1293 RepID=UPI001E5B2FFB|nr:restriction endonuclease subunit S [Staphylococcus gallinarum]MCD8872602.1 restriction endonuclease subunit S [Staphylococcus gallinarum]
MTNEVKNVPELRFSDFSDEWEEKKLEDLLKFNNGVNASKEQYGTGIKFINVLDILNTNFITYDKIIGRVNVSKAVENRNKVEYGDILFLRSSETREDVGMCNVYLDREKHSLYGGFIIRGKKIGEYSPFFLKILLNNSKARKSISSLAGGSTRFNVSQDILKVVGILVPKMNEQIKIGDFFSKLDRQIELEEQKLSLLEEQKKGYMQKIFSQELRFKDESGNEYPEWEEKKLFDVVKYLSSKRSSNYYSEDIIHGQYPVYDAVQEISRDTNFDIEESYISILKDGAGVGRLNLRPGKSSVIGTMGYLLPQNIDIKFLFYYLKTMNFNRFVIGSTIPHLYFKDYSKETILIPIDKSEQIKIGSFFRKLDSIINNKAKKIKVLKQRKQGFLQKMFI